MLEKIRVEIGPTMMREFGYIGMAEQGSQPIASPQAGAESNPESVDSGSVPEPSQDPGQ